MRHHLIILNIYFYQLVTANAIKYSNNHLGMVQRQLASPCKAQNIYTTWYSKCFFWRMNERGFRPKLKCLNPREVPENLRILSVHSLILHVTDYLHIQMQGFPIFLCDPPMLILDLTEWLALAPETTANRMKTEIWKVLAYWGLPSHTALDPQDHHVKEPKLVY